MKKYTVVELFAGCGGSALGLENAGLKTNITWPTAKIHIQKLERLKVLRVESTIRKNRVSVHPNFINIMKKHKGGNC